MKISILIPTRERTGKLLRVLDALIDKAFSPENYEILIAIDKDDEGTKYVLDHYMNRKEHHNIRYQIFERQYYKNLHVYVNTLAQQATGEFLWTLSDDLEMKTPHWDLIFQKYSGQFRFINVVVPAIQGPDQGVTAIIPRRQFEALGRFAAYSQIDYWCDRLAREVNIVVFEDEIQVDSIDPPQAWQHNRHDEKEMQKEITKLRQYMEENKIEPLITCPLYINTGNPEQDRQRYETIKNNWSHEHPH